MSYHGIHPESPAVSPETVEASTRRITYEMARVYFGYAEDAARLKDLPQARRWEQRALIALRPVVRISAVPGLTLTISPEKEQTS